MPGDRGRNLRLWCPIWKDPVGWGRWVGNSKAHIVISIILHAGFVFFALYVLGASAETREGAVRVMTPCILFIAVFLPSCYIYVIYRLIKMIDEKNDGERA